ncbi:N-acetyltransferase family protein [Alphaproteobacteria bacterium LSUCC0719]
MITVRPVEAADHAGWERLYRGYADFYSVATDDAKLQTFFGWLLDPVHVCEGLVAQTASGDLVGLAHIRAMPSPLRGAEVGFLDDLFVDPEHRGSGAAETLLREIDTIAAVRGWDIVRWITRDNNYRARSLYDRLAVRSDWITYEMTAASTGRKEA